MKLFFYVSVFMILLIMPTFVHAQERVEVKLRLVENRRELKVSLAAKQAGSFEISAGEKVRAFAHFQDGQAYTEGAVTLADGQSQGGIVPLAILQKPAGRVAKKLFLFMEDSEGRRRHGIALIRNGEYLDHGYSSGLVLQLGPDKDGDGFSDEVITLDGSKRWRALLDPDDANPDLSPFVDFSFIPRGDSIMDTNGDGVVELQYSDDVGKTSFNPDQLREGWIGKIPGPYQLGERVMPINGQLAHAIVIRGVR